MAEAPFEIAHWNRRGVRAALLAPLALAYAALGSARRVAYASGLARRIRLPVPTIVIGNFTVGGTGKTPLAIWLLETLIAMGRQPGIVSCGYGGSARGPRPVDATSDPRECGDEPVLIARRAGVPGFIGRDRGQAALALLEAHPEIDVVVCDDGLQHQRLARDFEIAVVDRRGYGNGLPLPAGPLRERPRPVDALVRNGTPAGPGEFAMRLAPAGLYRLADPRTTIAPESLAGQTLHAVAGIGSPARFFDTLGSLGLQFVPHAFPDHHPFREADLAFADADAILMTEKDAVKCARFERRDLIALRVQAIVDSPLADAIRARLFK